mmetsp:Transcript_23679/g.49043  ORF Transcript_23679/g.49043 Transcript_23679/m.49043 type:complete len:83 (+) Transcript_23679:201-449(+)
MNQSPKENGRLGNSFRLTDIFVDDSLELDAGLGLSRKVLESSVFSKQRRLSRVLFFILSSLMRDWLSGRNRGTAGSGISSRN